MMKLMFSLPLELTDLVLSFLNYDELTTLFDLDNIHMEKCSEYLIIKKMALLHCYNNQVVTLSNVPLNTVHLSEARLDYLIKSNLLIKPRKFKLLLNKDIKLMWLDYFKHFPDIHIIVSNMKHYGMFCCYTDNLTIASAGSLLIHLVNIDQILFTQKFNQLTHLDLSFNGLESLLNLNFPVSLKSLNLSNNVIWKIDTELSHLDNLLKLDLGNNNLLNFSSPLPKVNWLNLLGNNLLNNNFRNEYQNLHFLDLSRNLITNLTKFPSNLKFLDLSNNHLCQDFDLGVFPTGLSKLNLSWCRVDEVKINERIRQRDREVL